MLRTSYFEVATAVARSVAFGLGLGGLPWLGIYVVGRNLLERAAGWMVASSAWTGLAGGQAIARASQVGRH